MRFPDLLNRGTQRTRPGRIAVQGSPTFTFNSPAIAAGAAWVLNLTQNDDYGTAIAKYLPLDFAEVLNESGQPIRVSLQSVITLPVAAFGSRVIEDRAIASVVITNQGGAGIAAGAVVVLLERKGADADGEARRRAAGRFA